MRELQQRLRSSEASQAPLQQRIRALEAAASTAAAELSGAQEQAERWQKRAQQLMAKYESVDAQEHQRVLTELREAQEKQRAAEAVAAAATAEVASLQASLASEREALAALRQRLEEAEKENAATAGQAQELAKAKVGWAGKWRLVLVLAWAQPTVHYARQTASQSCNRQTASHPSSCPISSSAPNCLSTPAHSPCSRSWRRAGACTRT